ncbi:hypothetical protein DRF02_24420 [Salmonella enterica subsp. salamae]|nr:hypothetical protein [Salmonella enterica]ECC9297417.1 hypothetical protein [Salmonella enterica subsp. salamae]
MQAWADSQKNRRALREMKKEMYDFYFLIADLSVEGHKKGSGDGLNCRKNTRRKLSDCCYCWGREGAIYISRRWWGTATR